MDQLKASSHDEAKVSNKVNEDNQDNVSVSVNTNITPFTLLIVICCLHKISDYWVRSLCYVNTLSEVHGVLVGQLLEDECKSIVFILEPNYISPNSSQLVHF